MASALFLARRFFGKLSTYLCEGDDLTVMDLVENPQKLTSEDLQKIRDIALN